MIGTELAGRYLITGELGRGGMGVVYRARDPLLDREAAVKPIAQTHLNEEAIEGKGIGLTGFHIHSATDFTLELAQPVSFFPTLLAHPATGIVPEGGGGTGRSWQEGLVGTGPFRVTDYRPRERIEMERNPFYFLALLRPPARGRREPPARSAVRGRLPRDAAPLDLRHRVQRA